jgi:antitoxin component YwqK of YwqJK toxin-antitoxin module
MYHENGQLLYKSIWKDGVEDGPSEAYYENGQE